LSVLHSLLASSVLVSAVFGGAFLISVSILFAYSSGLLSVSSLCFWFHLDLAGLFSYLDIFVILGCTSFYSRLKNGRTPAHCFLKKNGYDGGTQENTQKITHFSKTCGWVVSPLSSMEKTT
jgi:hypothetical protein